MTKSISCADVGADCALGQPLQKQKMKLMEKVAQHAKEEHQGMEVTPELVAKIKSHIKEI